MIPRERAIQFLRFVYREGLSRAKASLSDSAKAGDKVSRSMLNAAGLCEQGQGKATALETRDFHRLVDFAGQIRLVLEARQTMLLADRLVEGLLDGTFTIATALKTLTT